MLSGLADHFKCDFHYLSPFIGFLNKTNEAVGKVKMRQKSGDFERI